MDAAQNTTGREGRRGEGPARLQYDPELDHGVAHDVGGHDPVGRPVLVELGQLVGPGVAARDVEEGQEGPVEDGEVVRRHAAEEHHPHHRSCGPRGGIGAARSRKRQGDTKIARVNAHATTLESEIPTAIAPPTPPPQYEATAIMSEQP